ncbi:MAG: MraZ N-terminal domain containing protein [Thaumarchaeota archaeon]|nr:MraZ N-terminal domain containing protein [Nitrososphaerota archaeon]
MQKSTSVDSKGRVTIPQEFREDLGDFVMVKKMKKGLLLLPGERRDFVGEFLKVMESEPKRTGRPANYPPGKMKSIWNERK